MVSGVRSSGFVARIAAFAPARLSILVFAGLAAFSPVFAAGPPVFRQPLVDVAYLDGGTVRNAFHRQILETGHDAATVYQASGLPPGITLDSVEGTLSGTPAQSGVYDVALDVTNGAGSVSDVLTIIVPATRWEEVPTANSVSLTEATHGLGLYVGASYGTIYTSVDGRNWTQVWDNIPDIEQLFFDGTQFVAVREWGWVMVSPDGQTWGTAYDMSNDNVTAITPSPSGYLAVASDGTVHSSPDLQSWAQVAVVPGMEFEDVTYGDGMFVGVGRSGGKIYSSPDGVAWTERVSGYTPSYGVGPVLHTVAHGDAGFVAGGATVLYHSPDGINWSAFTQYNLSSVYDLEWNGSIYVASAGQQVWTSTDGTSWFPRRTFGYSRGSLWSVACDGDACLFSGSNRLVALGDGLGTVAFGSKGLAVHTLETVSIPLPAHSTPSPALAAPRLPPGLVLDPVADAITGVPTTPGSYYNLVYGVNEHGVGEPGIVDITVLPADGSPFILSPPLAQTVMQGSSVYLTVSAGGGNIGYQWFLNGIPLAGATEDNLYVPVAQHADMGFYSVTATNAFGSHSSEPVPVVVMESYTQWADRLGLSPGGRDPGDEFHEQGFSNLMAYTLGMGSVGDSISRLPAAFVEGTQFCCRATIPKSVSGVMWHFERSDAMELWSGSGFTLHLVEDTGLAETWEARSTVSAGGCGFLRFCVEQE